MRYGNMERYSGVFEGYYQVSNLGRVKSLDRVITNKMGRKRNGPGFQKTTPDGKFGYGCLRA